jgi:hypothetical protein
VGGLVAGVLEAMHSARRNDHRLARASDARLRPRRKAIVPLTTSKRSSCSGCTWAPGTAPPGASTSSKASSSPSVSAAVWRKMIFSPLIGVAESIFERPPG